MSSVAVAVLKFINRFFPRPVHPFNLETEGKMSYAEWQFQQGHRTLEFYRPFASPREMIASKKVLDVGCGAGGKTCYYASLGATHVWGIDITPVQIEQAEQFAREKGLEDRCSFALADAADLPFSDASLDVVIMNDTMEHLANPEQCLLECLRVLRPDGRLYVNFPPYFHPYGAHLTDAIGIPWVHLVFSEDTLVHAYRELVAPAEDAERRLRLRLGDDAASDAQIVYTNGMTSRRFLSILDDSPFDLLYYREEPLRTYFSPLAHLPVVKECFLRMITAVLTPDRD